eukprot:Blabericola_migrator_1__12415@NODE_780_length_6551_cov_33_570019_g331_i3_p7_GENE_NODE_780_length_6551_cov_33_570019_g331_i3NODE_780_length_6551_cov_33_570019_g331_i3_p7_ORF_typecomplete_len114_score16_79_NODE_780_length_6551_cov_33_570019_g331_i32343
MLPTHLSDSFSICEQTNISHNDKCFNGWRPHEDKAQDSQCGRDQNQHTPLNTHLVQHHSGKRVHRTWDIHPSFGAEWKETLLYAEGAVMRKESVSSVGLLTMVSLTSFSGGCS